jgi:formylmethanofuran dehydrogenase subunit B
MTVLLKSHQNAWGLRETTTLSLGVMNQQFSLGKMKYGNKETEIRKALYW